MAYPLPLVRPRMHCPVTCEPGAANHPGGVAPWARVGAVPAVLLAAAAAASAESRSPFGNATSAFTWA